MYCKNCGSFVADNIEICPQCGFRQQAPQQAPQPTAYQTANPQKPDRRFLPSFILGLMAAIFGIPGGLCVTMCTSFGADGGVAAFILIFGGSIVGLIGACKCLSDAKVGSIIQLVAAAMIIICAFGITGGEIGTVLALVLFLVSGLIGLVYSLMKK